MKASYMTTARRRRTATLLAPCSEKFGGER
jgi:hypothetical protein